ncbi:hypothetical protein PFISCL1PPCAC_9594, partial [Pristionchus fissidentatus]
MRRAKRTSQANRTCVHTNRGMGENLEGGGGTLSIGLRIIVLRKEVVVRLVLRRLLLLRHAERAADAADTRLQIEVLTDRRLPSVEEVGNRPQSGSRQSLVHRRLQVVEPVCIDIDCLPVQHDLSLGIDGGNLQSERRHLVRLEVALERDGGRALAHLRLDVEAVADGAALALRRLRQARAGASGRRRGAAL